ncbi:FAD-dependent oxidoreductase [Streptomyces stramineus]|uniref:FAD-dependent oxidoreductase n=1 Tax=Streptomyces TaxID=1883 RepID=UPI0033C014D7
MTADEAACDVAVIGAGPAGCAAALAHARAGHRVLLLETSRRPPTRLAEEWLHPDGVAVLRKLGVAVPAPSFRPALGFVPVDSAGHVQHALPSSVRCPSASSRGGTTRRPHRSARWRTTPSAVRGPS